jgi:hypothetical protein
VLELAFEGRGGTLTASEELAMAVGDVIPESGTDLRLP